MQVEDEVCSHGNLLSMGCMLSVPSDNCAQPLKCSPSIGHEVYSGHSYSGNLGRSWPIKGNKLSVRPSSSCMKSNSSNTNARNGAPLDTRCEAELLNEFICIKGEGSNVKSMQVIQVGVNKIYQGASKGP